MKDIKLRIRSVESTMQITKAMQLVATSKLRRAKERMENSKPFAAISREAIMAAAAGCDDTVSYAKAREVRKRCFIIIAGDRGLAGGYNNNVFKAVAEKMAEAPCCVLPMGRKAVERYQRYGMELISDQYVRVEGMGVGACQQLADRLISGYDKGEYDEIVLVYTSFRSMLSQEVLTERLLPIDPPAEKKVSATVYEPGAAETLRQVLPAVLGGRRYSALCDAYASAVASRRTAMDSATKNAGAITVPVRAPSRRRPPRSWPARNRTDNLSQSKRERSPSL